MIQQRNLAVCIILTIVTCGIYGLVWLYWLNDDTNTVSNEPNPTSGGIVILLSIVTCGIYGIYWAYKQGEKLIRSQHHLFGTGYLRPGYRCLCIDAG